MSLDFDPETVEPRDLADRPECPECANRGRLARLRCDACMATGHALTSDEARAIWLARDGAA